MSRDKKITIHRAKKEMMVLLQEFESIAVKTMKEEFRFGKIRQERFLAAFRENARHHVLEKEKQLRNKIR